MGKARLAGRIVKGVAVLAMLGVLALGALLALLWLEHRTEVTLPTPSGSFAVGRTTYAWADDATSDTVAPVAGTKRELVVWIWYPAAAGQSAAVTADYLPARLRQEIERARGALISKFVTRDLSQVHTHSLRDADVSPQQRSYPVVIMRAGALDQLTRLNTSDAAGKFTGRLDMARVGVFGHSFGGATAAQFCHEDSRCKAGINVDGAPHGSVIQAGIQQPFMFLLSDHGDASDSESVQIMANIQSIYDRLPRDGRLRIAIRGANHFTFSDDGALLKSQIVQRTLRTLGILGIDGRRQLAITAYCVHSFFDAYLKGASVSRLEISSPLYPEIKVLQ